MKLIEVMRKDFKPGWLEDSDFRKAITKNDPLMFAVIYLDHHLFEKDMGQTLADVSLCDFHLDLIAYSKRLTKPISSLRPKEMRNTFIAPRQSGKSTWIFTIIPLWLAAHGHKKFIAAFGDSAEMAEKHLYTFKQELRENELLREDYPDLCKPKEEGNRALLFNANAIQMNNDFIFMAKGADSAALGMKLGAKRPDFLLFDDIEKGESNYGPTEIRKRRETLVSDLFYLNSWAPVAIVGTTTMPNSLIDQMRKVNDQMKKWDGEPEDFRESLDPDLRWILDENINVHYWPVILTDEEGNETSLWPERWSMEELNAMRHTRDFAKNMMNRPVSAEEGLWKEDDITIKKCEVEYKHTILSVDPAVTTKKRSDFTGLSVVAVGKDNKIYLRWSEQVKMNSEQMSTHVASLCEKYNVDVIFVEVNQGGDLWRGVFKEVPARYKTIRQREKKELRAERAFGVYQKGLVFHEGRFPSLEEQMLAFPNVAHDDVLDSMTSGVLYFKRPGGKPTALQFNYQEV